MASTRVKIALVPLLAIGLVGGTSLAAHPLRSEKQTAERRANDKQALTDLYGDPLPTGAVARLGTVRFRHGGTRMSDVLFSPDGRTLISAGGRSFETWDVPSGRRKRQTAFSSLSPYYVSGIDLSPDGKLLAVTRYESKTMRFWDLVSGAEVHPFGDDAPAAIRAAFSPNGELLATLEFQNPFVIRIWDIRRGKKIRTIEGGGAFVVRSLAFSPNGKLLAFPSKTEVRVWDVAAGKELYRLDPGTKAPMGSVAFSFDGKLLAAAGDRYPDDSDHSIHLWDADTGKQIGALKGHEDVINALAMSPKGDLLVSASRDGTIRFWDLAKRQEIGRSPTPFRFYSALRFSADGRVLASGEETGVLRLWDPQKHEEIADSTAKGNSIQWAAFTPDGQSLISATTEQIGEWEPLTGRLRRTFNAKYLVTYRAALSPDGKALATTSHWNQGQLLLWDVAAGKLLRQLGESDRKPGIASCAFSASGRRLAGGSYDEDIIRVWDAASGKELQRLKGQRMARSVAFAPDGKTLASAETGGDSTVRLWKLSSGEEVWRKGTRPWAAFDLKFSPDGRLLALAGGELLTRGEVRLWDAATGREIRRCQGHRDRVNCVAFSGDGRMLATGSNDNTVRLWEVATGQERRCFRGHQDRISAISFSPDGRLLVSASSDTTALVWDLTGRYRDGRFHSRRLSLEERRQCWGDLAQADAARAYRSIIALCGSPDETIPFLKDQLPPLTAADPKRVASLLAALDSEQFTERDEAMTELEKLGLTVEAALRKALIAKPSLEVRRRIETILEKLAAGPRLRFLRSLEVLEQIATAQARQALEALSHGSTELWPTQEAKASLNRLTLRPAVKPGT